MFVAMKSLPTDVKALEWLKNTYLYMFKVANWLFAIQCLDE